MLTIRPAGLLLPDEGVIALFVTGLAELIAGDEDGLFMLRFSGVASSCKWEGLC